jgi:hypothetical protein
MMFMVAAITLLMSTAPGTVLPPAETSMSDTAQTWSCSQRRLCTQISTCAEARWYLKNCSWGHRLDGEGDGIPCEKLCGSAP